MLRFEVEKIENGKVTVRLTRPGMDECLLMFEKGEYVEIQSEIRQHGYTCDLIRQRDHRFTPKLEE